MRLKNRFMQFVINFSDNEKSNREKVLTASVILDSIRQSVAINFGDLVLGKVDENKTLQPINFQLHHENVPGILSRGVGGSNYYNTDSRETSANRLLECFRKFEEMWNIRNHLDTEFLQRYQADRHHRGKPVFSAEYRRRATFAKDAACEMTLVIIPSYRLK
eukprot:jgi/Bigna1/78405/fgenesh1_pg.54_\